ncbi:small subunit ribosomal protein S25e [Nematocida sp. LUAm3]|nr:small subunit ribosomal protein S25e [Nematocida sp. LUAm3]KAI5174736.1 small subunit ribosomal protein S25e [Nematocida sp. LUAm2]KAI5177853.1 small subunit ribosomal protein S25e [Nematocida sp. LUAm1]
MAAKKVADTKGQKKGGAAKPTKKKEPKKWVTTVKKETVLKNVIINEEAFGKMKKEIVGMSVVTPASIATKHNLSYSLAKQILDEILKTGEIEIISKSGFGTIYGKKLQSAETVASEVEVPAAA